MAGQKVSKLYYFCHREPHRWYSMDGATKENRCFLYEIASAGFVPHTSK